MFYYSPFFSQANTNWVYDNRDVVDWDDTSNLVTPLDKDKTLYYINKTYGNNTLPYLSDGVKNYRDWETDRKSTRLNSSHSAKSRMPSSA